MVEEVFPVCNEHSALLYAFKFPPDMLSMLPPYLSKPPAWIICHSKHALQHPPPTPPGKIISLAVCSWGSLVHWVPLTSPHPNSVRTWHPFRISGAVNPSISTLWFPSSSPPQLLQITSKPSATTTKGTILQHGNKIPWWFLEHALLYNCYRFWCLLKR